MLERVESTGFEAISTEVGSGEEDVLAWLVDPLCLLVGMPEWKIRFHTRVAEWKARQ